MDQLSLAGFSDLNSLDSKELATQAFLDTTPQSSLALVPVKGPSYTSTLTWKSPAIKDKEEYERLRQRVRHVAPELFKSKAGRCLSDIFPQNVAEYLIHKKGMLAMAEAESRKNCELLKDQIEARLTIPVVQRKIKSVFGKEAKTFDNVLSPVLALPTIWTPGITTTAPWPTKADLQATRDSKDYPQEQKRERYLPRPLVPANSVARGQQRPIFPQFPLDATGPGFASDPSPIEIIANNHEMDCDPEFEEYGSLYLGDDLMGEIGQWQPPFIPQIRKQEVVRKPSDMVIYEEDGMFGTPDVDDETWDESMVSDTWEVNQVWY